MLRISWTKHLTIEKERTRAEVKEKLMQTIRMTWILGTCNGNRRIGKPHTPGKNLWKTSSQLKKQTNTPKALEQEDGSEYQLEQMD